MGDSGAPHNERMIFLVHSGDKGPGRKVAADPAGLKIAPKVRNGSCSCYDEAIDRGKGATPLEEEAPK